MVTHYSIKSILFSLICLTCSSSTLLTSVFSPLCLCSDHNPDAESLPHRLVPEERISFGINPAISTLTTVAQIREDYNEVDCRLIAKEVR